MDVPIHTIILDDLSSASTDRPITIAGEEAKHAVRVKRLRAGQPVRLIDGSGRVVVAQVEEAARQLVVWPREVEVEPDHAPDLIVLSAAPKGQRLEKMIDMLTQTGAAAWRPLETTRSVVEPGAGKYARLQRVVREATKQCGRARFMRIEASVLFADAIADAQASGRRLVVADAQGERWQNAGDHERGQGVSLFVGPEGGFTADELETLRDAGAAFVRLSPCVMRIETAAVAGAAAIMAG